MGAFQGYVQGSQQAELEQERQRKLQQLDLQNTRSSLTNDALSEQNAYAVDRNDRQRQQWQIEDERRLAKLKALEGQQARLNFDMAFESAQKGDYGKLKQTLMNSTDDNLNKDVKQMLEEHLGGTISDVRTPDKALLQDGEEYHPDQVEIEYIKKNGEKAVQHLSLGTLGGMMGTPSRIGDKKFADLVSGKEKQAVLDAKRNSIQLDGTMKGYQQELLQLAVDGNDEARKVLDSLSELKAANGETLMGALTTKYMQEKDPKERDKILESMKSLRKVMTATAKPAPTKPLEKAQQAVLDAQTPEELELAKKKLETLQLAKSSSQSAVAKKAALDQYETEQQQKAQEALHKVVNVDNIIKGKVTPDAIDKSVQSLTSAYKTTKERAAAVKRLSNRVQREAMDRGYLDLTDNTTRTGRLSPEGREVMKTLKNLETYQSEMLNSSTTKEQKKVVDSTIMTLRSHNDAVENYDKLVSLGLFKDVGSTGAANWLQKSVQDLFGTLGQGDKDTAAKALVHFKGQTALIDELHQLNSKKHLTTKERARKAALENTLGKDFFRQMSTDTYLTLKKMLQSISGMGVTDKELQSYKEMFSGKSGTSLPSLMENLANSAYSQLRLGNDAANGMISNGLAYSGNMAILNARKAGSYLINTRWNDKDISQGINQRISTQIPLKAKSPEVWNQFTSAITNHLKINPGLATEWVAKAQDWKDTHGTMQGFLQNTRDIPKSQYANVKSVLDLYDRLEETALAGSKEDNANMGK